MDTIQLNLNKSQFINVFASMNDSDKVEIFNELRKSLFSTTATAVVKRRKIGILEGKASFKEVGNGKITEKEFLGL
jgi:hypothetical protein